MDEASANVIDAVGRDALKGSSRSSAGIRGILPTTILEYVSRYLLS